MEVKNKLKAIGIVGSPRKDGNSAYLTQQVLQALDEKYETELISLKDLDINPCESCFTCQQEGVCIIEDDMQELYKKIQDASVLILASPVHMGGITSRMRMFMERMWHLRKGQLKGIIGSYIIVGRRDLGVAVNEMEEFLSRLKALKIAGIMAFGVKKGAVKEDQEALENVKRVCSQILSL